MAGISRPEKELNTFKEVVLSSGERKDVVDLLGRSDSAVLLALLTQRML